MTSPQTIRNRLAAATEKAGIPFHGLHSLRHTNASIMLSLNTPDKYAMERGGWSSDKTMKQTYQHTMSETRKKNRCQHRRLLRLHHESQEAPALADQENEHHDAPVQMPKNALIS